MKNLTLFPDLQNKITIYQKEVEAKEQKILQQEEELNALENEMCAFRDQNKGLDTVLKRLQRNFSDCEMECEKLKKVLNTAQQKKSHYKEKCEKLESERQKIEFLMENASEREMEVVQGMELCMICTVI